MAPVESFSAPNNVESRIQTAGRPGDEGCANELARQQADYRSQNAAAPRGDAAAAPTAQSGTVDFGAAGDIYKPQDAPTTYRYDNGATAIDTQRNQVSNRYCQVGIALDTQPQAPAELTNTPQGWSNAIEQVSKLPLTQQAEIYGKAIYAGAESYRHDQEERAWGTLIGTVQGVGDLAVGVAAAADFAAACIVGDQDRAGKMGADFGNAVGQAIVGGVNFFNAMENYSYNIGYTGDYGKPFRDMALVGQKLDEHWSSLSPREQEREKSEFITNLVGQALITEAGIGAIKKAGTFTAMVDAAANNLKDATIVGGKKAITAIGQAVDTLVPPIGDTGTGMGMPIPRSPENDFNSLIAKMTKSGNEEPIGIRSETPRTPESSVNREPNGSSTESTNSESPRKPNSDDSEAGKTNDSQENSKPTDSTDKLPAFDKNGNLPPGIWECSVEELERRYATSPERKVIFENLMRTVDELEEGGCQKVYVGGSFVTSKGLPGDFDMCFDDTGMDFSKINRHFEEPRIFGESLRNEYGGDIKRYNPKDWKHNYLHFFQRDGRNNNVAKGIVMLSLGDAP